MLVVTTIVIFLLIGLPVLRLAALSPSWARGPPGALLVVGRGCRARRVVVCRALLRVEECQAPLLAVAGVPGGGMTAAVAGAAAPAAAGPSKDMAPLEASRPVPFMPREAAAAMVGPGGAKRAATCSQLGTPVTVRTGARYLSLSAGFTKGGRAGKRSAPRIAGPASSEKVIRVSGVSWSDGAAMALWENDKGDSGVLKPGDFVDSWQAGGNAATVSS